MSRIINSDTCETFQPAPQTERAPRIVRREILEARTEAEAIIKEAHRQAHLLHAEACERAASVAQTEASVARGREEARLAASFLQLEEERRVLVERARERGLEVAILLAERLIERSLEIDPQLIVVLADRAMAQTRGSADVTLVSHPDDHPAVQVLLTNYPSVRLDVDASLSRGDLRLVTNLGIIDATIRPQLAQLAHALRGAI